MSVREGFGKAKEGSGIEYLKVGIDETKAFRIFPPKGKLSGKGTWALYHQQHYGYGVPDPKDPSKSRARPFLCVEEKEGEITKVSCPECRKIEDKKRVRKEQYDAEMVRLAAEKVPLQTAEAQAEKLVKELDEWISSHNLDRKWYMIALGEDGRIGYLVIPHKAKKAMDVEKKKLAADEKIDLLDIDGGAWVEVTRTGKGRNTEYAARIAQEQIITPTGARAKVTKVSGLSDAQLQQAFDLPDLDSGSIVRKLTRDQVRLLAEGSGDPQEVETILNLGQRETRKEESPAPRAPVAEEAPRAARLPQVQVQVAPATPAADPQADAIAALQAQLAKLMAPKAPVVQVMPAAPTEDIKGMSDDDFMAKFGPKQ